MISALTVVVAVLGACPLVQSEPQKHTKPIVQIVDDYVDYATSVTELWDSSTTVVFGRVSSSSVRGSLAEDGLSYDVTTHHMVEIDEVLKDPSGRLAAGATIEVIERTGEYDAGDKIIHRVSRNRHPLKKNRQAVLFLESKDGEYHLVDPAAGSYNFEDDGTVRGKPLLDAKASKREFFEYLRSMKNAAK